MLVQEENWQKEAWGNFLKWQSDGNTVLIVVKITQLYLLAKFLLHMNYTLINSTQKKKNQRRSHLFLNHFMDDKCIIYTKRTLEVSGK